MSFISLFDHIIELIYLINDHYTVPSITILSWFDNPNIFLLIQTFFVRLLNLIIIISEFFILRIFESSLYVKCKRNIREKILSNSFIILS